MSSTLVNIPQMLENKVNSLFVCKMVDAWEFSSVQRLGLCTLTDRARVQSLGRELRSCKPHSMAKNFYGRHFINITILIVSTFFKLFNSLPAFFLLSYFLLSAS